MSEIIKLQKRMDTWREYRDEINKESIQLSNHLNQDKRLQKIYASLNSIDESILSNLDIDVELAGAYAAKSNLSDQYNSLLFTINSLDGNLLKTISDGIEEAEAANNARYLVDAKGEFIDSPALEKFSKAEHEFFPNVISKINNAEIKIQTFPKSAQRDLTVLHEVLEKIKNKLGQKPINNVDTRSVVDSTNLKILYFVIFGIIITSIIIAIVISIVFLVL